MLESLVYMTIILFWALGVSRYVMIRNVRNWILSAAACMLLWMVLRTMRYDIFNDRFWDGFTFISRHLWYSYYIPQVLIPLFIFYSIACLENEDYRLIFRRKLLLIPAVILVILFMTNDLHQLAFHFHSADWDHDYSYGLVFYLYMLWLIFLTVGASVLAVFYIYKNENRWSFLPFLWLTLMVLYHLYYQYGRKYMSNYILEYPEAFCLMYIGLINTYISLRLIPSSFRYREIFENSELQVCIKSREGKDAYYSGESEYFTESNCKRADEGRTELGNGLWMESYPISGGDAYYVDDLSITEDLEAELSEIRDLLDGEKALLIEERQIKEKKARIDIQNHLYDDLSNEIGGTLNHIEAILDEIDENSIDFCSKLGKVCVLGAYVKRRGNLVLLGEQSDHIRLKELGLCMQESVNYIRMIGINCNLYVVDDGAMPSNIATGLYDVFESVIEKTLGEMTDLMLTLKMDGESAFVDMAMEGSFPEITLREKERREGILLEAEEQDGTLYVRIKGGQQL